MRAFGVFEGGGVRGYAHLGALKACEDRGIRFDGVSGTSIGAIVAALVAAGYRSTDLYAVDQDGVEQGLFAVDVVETFLDPVEYARLRRLRAWRERYSDFAKRGREAAAAGRARIAASRWSRFIPARLIPARVSSLGHRARGSLEFAWVSVPPLYATAMPLAAFHWRLLRTVYGRSGVLGSARFTDWLNARLAERLGMGLGATVTFADLPIPLACIATNLSTGTMAVFNKASFPGMSVAEAAMASACYPLVFKPRRINGDAFVDGGLLSNFPAWTLDAERAGRDTVIPTFGFRVVDALTDDARAWPGDREPGLVDVVKRIVAAAMWGRGDLESRRIDDLHPMLVETHIKATDFHTIAEKRAELYRVGRKRAQEYFQTRLGPQDPAAMQRRLLRLRDIVRDVASASGRVRAYLIQPSDAGFARVVHAALYEDDADDHLTFRRGSACQALCLDRREPVLMRAAGIDEAARRSPATKLVHALRPGWVSHAYCVPMFADRSEWSKTNPLTRAEPVAAFCVDFDAGNDLLLLEPEVEDALAAIGDALVDLWMGREGLGLPGLEPGNRQPPSGDWTALGPAGFFASSRKTRDRPVGTLQDRIVRATF